jgi:radical SAM protein with 4Fe4S-binding SPASM domain
MTTQASGSPYTLSACNWELTLRCNLKCLHCGSRAGRARPAELTMPECCAVADELSDLGCRELTFIGGEVFLFKGWDDLSRRLTDKGVLVNIVSNGYRIRDVEIAQIRHAGLVNVGISIDGMETNHNRIRGRADAFARVRQSLDLLRDAGIRVGAVTSLMRFNCRDLDDLYDFLCGRGVQVWQLQLVSAMGGAAGRPDLLVGPRQVRRLTEFIREKNRERRLLVLAADSIGYFDDNEAYIRGNDSPICCWSGCKAGITSVFIDSVGNVKGCGALYADDFIEGNVRARPLTDIWNATDAFSYNRRFTTDVLAGTCRHCDVGDVCRGGCRSSNYFATGSLYSSAFCCRPHEPAARRRKPEPTTVALSCAAMIDAPASPARASAVPASRPSSGRARRRSSTRGPGRPLQ